MKSGLKRITKIEILILTVFVLLAGVFLLYEVNKTIVETDKETKILVSEAVRNISSVQTIHSDHLQLLKCRAEELLRDKASDYNFIKKRIVSVKGKGWELTPDEKDSITYIGRLSGSGKSEDLSPKVLQEIYTAEKLNQLFAETKRNLPNAPFVYYVSKSDFWNLTPRHTQEFAFFIHEYLTYDLYTFGLPENNAARAVFWTKPYMDAGGNGIMVTAGIPVYSNDEFMGTICIDMLFNDIANYLKSTTFTNRYVSLIDNYGQVVSSTFQHLAAPDKIPTLQNLINAQRSDIKRFKNNTFVWDNNNRVYISPIPNSQWCIFHFNARGEFYTIIIVRVMPVFVAVLFFLIILYYLLYSNRLRIENEEARILAEKSNETKDKFLSIIAHDLRSPFTYLLGFSDMMKENFITNNIEEQKELFGHIYTGIRNVYKLVDNLLLWARSQKESISFNPVEIELNTVVSDTIESLVPLSNNKALRISNTIPADSKVIADKSMLATIMRNLVSNAIKFTPKNGSIVISAIMKDKFAEVSIQDTGIGIEAEQLHSLFDISEKTSTSGTEGESGTGLGLLLCKEFIEKHGGVIKVESVVGKGSTFYFTLPSKI